MRKKNNKRDGIIHIKRSVYVPGYKRSNWPKWLFITLCTLAVCVFSYWIFSRIENKSGINRTTSIPNNAYKPLKKDLEGPFKVTRVVDGDTADISINNKIERIRMIGMDTPETVDPSLPVQCFGPEADRKARDVLTDKLVYLEFDNTQSDKDKYGRLLRHIFLEDNTNFSELMIREGYAVEYTYDKPYKYQTEYKNAEKDAKNNLRGLWSPSTCNGKISLNLYEIITA